MAGADIQNTDMTLKLKRQDRDVQAVDISAPWKLGIGFLNLVCNPVGLFPVVPGALLTAFGILSVLNHVGPPVWMRDAPPRASTLGASPAGDETKMLSADAIDNRS
ncbi:MAG: hypothetical protein ACKVVP_08630 [Chloroflexota bacterium]